jgi:hypothetical protein
MLQKIGHPHIERMSYYYQTGSTLEGFFLMIEHLFHEMMGLRNVLYYVYQLFY